jgi:hypothetical protein
LIMPGVVKKHAEQVAERIDIHDGELPQVA